MNGNERGKLIYEAAVYNEQLKLLQKEIERISLAIVELRNAEKVSEELKKSMALVPVGAGAYIRAELAANTILVPIGAGYLVEMEKDVAEREFKRRIASTEKALERFKLEFEKVRDKLREVEEKIKVLQSTLAHSKKVDEELSEDYL